MKFEKEYTCKICDRKIKPHNRYFFVKFKEENFPLFHTECMEKAADAMAYVETREGEFSQGD